MEKLPMPKVTIVESWMPNVNPGPHNSPAETDLAFVAGDRPRAMAFVAARPDYCTDVPWCFVVYDVEIDDEKHRAIDKVVVGFDGKVYGAPGQAWEAWEAANAPAGTPGV
jgi:hypothetical protein